jgi:hypothetical protein
VFPYVVSREFWTHTGQVFHGCFGVGFPFGFGVVVDLLDGFVAGFNGCGYVK